MRLCILAFATISFAMIALPANAGPNCTCRANGTKFEVGQIACITLPSGNRLVQCEMVLNNTSWKILSGSCPTSFLEDQKAKAPMSEPAASPHIEIAGRISG
jgi:hypothetical protein